MKWQVLRKIGIWEEMLDKVVRTTWVGMRKVPGGKGGGGPHQRLSRQRELIGVLLAFANTSQRSYKIVFPESTVTITSTTGCSLEVVRPDSPWKKYVQTSPGEGEVQTPNTTTNRSPSAIYFAYFFCIPMFFYGMVWFPDHTNFPSTSGCKIVGDVMTAACQVVRINIPVWWTFWRPMVTVMIGQMSWHRFLRTIVLPPIRSPSWLSTPWLFSQVLHHT